MRTALCLLVATLTTNLLAYEPIPRRLPKAGQPVPAQLRADLERSLAHLPKRTDPDVEIYTKAVRLALEFDEFYDLKKDIPKAEHALAEAQRRHQILTTGRADWRNKPGLVVRGYRSSIDNSAQPYGLEIPESLSLTKKKVPLYVWLHGRGDSKTDLHFIDERSKRNWQFKGLLDDGIVLHPFGRQCIGFKSAGEIDVLEAVDHVIKNYNVDPNRIALMGFSMGGAGAWHLGAHYADKWAVVHAGAGFVDVKRYQKLKPEQFPPAVEQKLWGLYDVPSYARNLLNIPVLAYSGEVDKQKDAADYMEEVLKAHGFELPHIVGAGMGHKYDKDSLRKVAEQIRNALVIPRPQDPKTVHLQTQTLRYNRFAWLEVTALDEHWQDARIDAARPKSDHLRITTTNIRAFRIDRPLPTGSVIEIDGKPITLPRADKPSFEKTATGWTLRPNSETKLRKSPQRQGPIDDAFLTPFLVVAPSGKSKNPALDQWVQFELDHLRTRWRALYRGDLPLKIDRDVTVKDSRKYNLVLFGTPESNEIMARALKTMPLQWPAEDNRVLLGIYPNVQTSNRYLVLNSGPTFREAHDRTNSLQNPKLGDWAIIDLSEPPGPERPGKIIKAGFFNEEWQLP